MSANICSRYTVTDSAFIIVLSVFCIIYFSLFLSCGINFYDEGNLLYYSQKTYDGELVFNDFIALFSLKYHFYALAFKIFGKSILTARYVSALFRLLAVLLTFLCARKFLSPYYSFMASICFAVASGPWHKTYICFLFMLNLYIVLSNDKKPINPVYIGLLMIFNTYMRPIVAVFMNAWIMLCCTAQNSFYSLAKTLLLYSVALIHFWISSMVFFGLFGFHYTALFLFIALSFLILFLFHILCQEPRPFQAALYFLVFSSLILFFTVTVFSPGLHSALYYSAHKFSAPDTSVFLSKSTTIVNWFENFLSSVVENSSLTLISPQFYYNNTALLFLIALTVFLFCVFSFRMFLNNRQLFIFFSFTIVLALKYIQRMDLPHFLQSSMPFFIIIALSISVLEKKIPVIIPRILIFILCVGYIAGIIRVENFYGGTISIKRNTTEYWNAPMAKIYENPHKLIHIESAVRHMRNLCSDESTFFAFPDAPCLYFLAEKNSLFFDNLTFPVERSSQFQKFLVNTIFPAISIKYCLFLKEKNFIWNQSFEQRFPVLFDCLTRTGKMVYENEMFVIYSIEWN